jgi:uncharacterized protein (TIGR02466 family)
MLISNIDSKSAIVSIFPKTIYYVKDLLEDGLDKLITVINDSDVETLKGVTLSVNSTHTTFNQLHKISEFEDLSNKILYHANLYGKLLGYSEKQLSELHIENMWFNRSGQGDFNFPHKHHGSMFSGAFYLQATKENRICFHNFEDSNIIPENASDLQNIESWIQCIPNHLIIFKGDLIHSNPRQEGLGEKIVISFNIMHKENR